MQKINCLNCDKKFSPKRNTAVFCTDTCRSNFHQKKQRWNAKLSVLDKQRIALQQQIKETHNAVCYYQQALKKYGASMIPTGDRIYQIRKLLLMDDYQLVKNNDLKDHLKAALLPYSYRPNWGMALLSGVLVGQVFLQLPEKAKKIRVPLYEELNTLESKWESLQGQLKQGQKMLRRHQHGLKSLKQRLLDVEMEISSINDQLKKSESKKRETNKTHSGTEVVKGRDLIKMKFDTFNLPGNIGTFLGELDRQKLAIGLSGDPGAGKSYFSVLLAHTLAKQDLKVIYFSLEMGIGKSLQRGALNFRADDVDFVSEGSLETVKKKAKVYDVVVVDSFLKLGCKAESLDELRNTYPETIFIFILQANAKGESRGGPAIDYDASMLIHMSRSKEGERFAYMKKSRTGTVGYRYLLKKDTVILPGEDT
jgi:DNA replication protein DnaC